MSRIRHVRRALVLAAGLLISSGCTSAGNASLNTSPNGKSDIHVSVRNDNGFPVTVFAVGSGITWKLGKIDPALDRDFKVPTALVSNGPVQFVAVADGSSPVRSIALNLRPGQVVDFTVKSPLYASEAFVRR